MSPTRQTKTAPIRILHVVRMMHRGGIETWLMHVLRHIDRARFQMDFLVHDSQPGAHDAEVRALGSNILLCPNPSQPLRYAAHFQRLLAEHGPYDVVHSHIHHFGGYIMRLARLARVPVRIVHSHLDQSAQEGRAGLLRRSYLGLMKHWIARHATMGMAASRKAAASLFGPDWQQDPRWKVFYCGIDLAPFREPANRDGIRSELHIPPDAFVIGHVGRFFEQKNHTFLLDIAAEVYKREPGMRVLLIGDGPLRAAMEQKAARLGLSQHIIFAGIRADVPQLMLGAMDVFLLPSLFEGLPVVGMETQAAGLPLVLSDSIAEETDIINPLLQRLSLQQPAGVWAEAVLAARRKPPAVSRSAALDMIEASPFNIRRGVELLGSAYASHAR